MGLYLDCKTVHIFVYSSHMSSQTNGLEWVRKQRARLGRHAYATLYQFLYWFWEKNRLFCSLDCIGMLVLLLWANRSMNIVFILQNSPILWLTQSHTTPKCLFKILAHSSFFVFIFVVLLVQPDCLQSVCFPWLFKLSLRNSVILCI